MANTTYQMDFWTHRLKRGERTEEAFAHPQMLADAAKEYFDWAYENPLQEEKVFSNKDGIEYASVNKMRAFSLPGFLTFIGITKARWEKLKALEVFASTCEAIDLIMYTQKFEGAAAGLLNANVISREIGLSEKHELTGAGGTDLFKANMSLEDLLAAAKERGLPLGEFGE